MNNLAYFQIYWYFEKSKDIDSHILQIPKIFCFCESIKSVNVGKKGKWKNKLAKITWQAKKLNELRRYDIPNS